MPQSESTVKLAQQALEEAQIDLQGKQNELVALEAELASVEGDPRQSNSIEELGNSLSRIMKEMAQGGCVPQNIMQDTQGHMTSLLAGLR